MEDAAIIKTIEAKNEAIAALEQIVGCNQIRVTITERNSNLGIQVSWRGEHGVVTRHFSWTIENPGSDGLKLQWIYNALSRYDRLQRMIAKGRWNN